MTSANDACALCVYQPTVSRHAELLALFFTHTVDGHPFPMCMYYEYIQNKQRLYPNYRPTSSTTLLPSPYYHTVSSYRDSYSYSTVIALLNSCTPDNDCRTFVLSLYMSCETYVRIPEPTFFVDPLTSLNICCNPF
jgi:hypothetical protein